MGDRAARWPMPERLGIHPELPGALVAQDPDRLRW